MYAFYPEYEIGKRNTCFVESTKGFSQDDISDIKSMCEKLTIEPGVTISQYKQPVFNNYRRCDVAWLEYTQDSKWLYDKLSYMVQKVNKEFFNYDLFGFLEPFQYTVYDDTVSGHYDWHVDRADSGDWALSMRKLSLSIQLSDDSEYEGGELLIKDYSSETIIKKELGTMVFFPSFALHRVTPVTKGTRKSLVAWVAGPPFK